MYSEFTGQKQNFQYSSTIVQKKMKIRKMARKEDKGKGTNIEEEKKMENKI